MMLSGVGASDQLDALGIETKVELKAVGENFRDHYAAATFFRNIVDLPANAPIMFLQSPTFNILGPEKKKVRLLIRWRFLGTLGPSRRFEHRALEPCARGVCRCRRACHDRSEHPRRHGRLAAVRGWAQDHPDPVFSGRWSTKT